MKQKSYDEWCRTCVLCNEKEKIKNNTSNIHMVEVYMGKKAKYLPVHYSCFMNIPDIPDDHFM